MYERSDPPSATKLRRLDARERRVWRKASGTVAITAALMDALEKRHGEGTSSLVIADGCRSVDTIPPPITPVNGDTGAKVFYIGQLYPWKGIDVLIRAMAEIAGAELVVVGGLPPEPDLDRAQQLVEKLSIAERVTFRGFVPVLCQNSALLK